MYKIKYFIVCICFLFACKNDQKSTDAAVIPNGESQTSNPSVSQGDGQINNAQPSVGQDNATSNGAVPVADNVITSSSTTANTNNAPNTGSPNNAVTPKQGNSSTNADAGKITYGKSKSSETLTTILPDDTKYPKGPNLTIPDPCTLIGITVLNTNFGLTSAPEIKSGSRVPKPGDKSCFFKFNDSSKPNAGIMLQIMTNPYPEEIDDYPSLIVEGKIKDGEQSPYDKTPKKFKSWNEFGDGGCYSYDAGKYHWKINRKYLFLLAFNTSHNEAQQKQIASSIAKEVMKNFAAKIK